MAAGVLKLALAELLLAAGVLAIGVPIARDAFYGMRFQTNLESVLASEQRGEVPIRSIVQLAHADPPSEVEQSNLAFALLNLAAEPKLSQSERALLIDRSILQFESYVAKVPGDGAAWAGLASGELNRGDTKRAVAALKASIFATPWSPALVAWRCGLGIDLFRALDDEGRELMKGQLRVQARRSVKALVDIVAARNAVRFARILLAASPDELIAFEAELAKRR